MANSLISMIKGDSTLINNTEVLDGQVLFNTDEKTILLDDDNTRTKYCGADKSNKNLAPIENGNTATRGYAAGSYVVWKEQLYKVLTQINSGTAFVVGTNIALDTVGAELTQINSNLSNKQDKLTNPLTQSDVVDNLISTSQVKPLSAKQGKVLHDYLAKLSTVTPSSSGKSTLATYIKDVVYPMGLNVYSFTAVNFPDLPISSWYFEVTVYAGNGFANVTAFKANDKGYYYVRGLDGNLNWDRDWARLSAYELKTWSGAIGSYGLINTGISTTDYMVVGVENNRASIVIPLSSGQNWYVQCFDLGGSTPSGGDINLTLMCVRL